MTSTETHEQSWTHEPRENLEGADAGPWDSEPDKAHWIDPDTGLDCLIVRNGGGAWCGYVGLPPGHRFHSVGYDECTVGETCGNEWCHDHSPNAAVSVHGRLTFSASCHEDRRGESYGICHVPLPGRPADVWWLGFDCAHAGDESPAYRRYRGPGRDETYRDLAYVKAETTSLARQLAAVST